MTRLVGAIALLAGVSCASKPPMPVAFDSANEPCAFCRMVGSTGRFAAQLVGPAQDPVFFDDIGCLRGYLRSGAGVADEAIAYVVDHRTGVWIQAGRAIYTENKAVSTPMGSHLLAHESAASRTADPDATGGTLVLASGVFSGTSLPGGTP